MNPLQPLGEQARAASRILASLRSSRKDAFLLDLAQTLVAETDQILAENEKDLAEAKKNGIGTAMQDRLLLTAPRIAGIADAVREVAALPDPVGIVRGGGVRPNGLELVNQSVPLGVIGLIYEARPNVTIDCAVLCLKAGNACILRGGSEAIHSNKALAAIIQKTLEQHGLPAEAVQLLEDTDRETATHLMQLEGYIDVLIPRGGRGLIQSVVKNATVPVIETGAGLCHIYVDQSAKRDMAVDIVVNAKTSRPSVCNAVETLLVHEAEAAEFLPALAEALDGRVELRGCPRTLAILPDATPAEPEDWATEYDDYILAIRIVDSLEEAVEHIRRYSTMHSEAIVTESYARGEAFTHQVDAAAVYINASTRFTDGGEFGLGAEIGISTQKLHVRGPMGLSALTTNKFIVRGQGQVRN